MIRWSKKILITGGLGYIGSHLVRALNERGKYLIDVLDKNVTESANYDYVSQRVNNIIDHDLVDSDKQPKIAFASYDAIVHLAAYISVGESAKEPVKYWINNLLSTERLLDRTNIHTHFIFASTGTAFCPENAYAYSKCACEKRIIERSNKTGFGYTVFRFFNVSGLCDGIQPTGEATHLIRRAAMAARGEIDKMSILGDAWGTADGTAIRDYIHVEDIANSIVNAIEYGPTNSIEGLGSGEGYSVKQVIDTMKKVSGVDFKVEVTEPRPGDVAKMVCESQYKHLSLKHDLESMCLSAFKGK